MTAVIPRHATLALVACLLIVGVLGPQAETAQDQSPAGVSPTEAPQAFRIGVEDVLDMSVWKNPDLTRTVQVRPDGKISLPLINDVQAAGFTPTQLQEAIAKEYAKYFRDLEIS